MLAIGVVGMPVLASGAQRRAWCSAWLPVIGVPLPLFAYGGSALVTTLIAVGLLMNVSMRRYVF